MNLVPWGILYIHSYYEYCFSQSEERVKKEMERLERERRKEEERLMREKQREEERLQREQKREMERREKFLQKEYLRVSLRTCFVDNVVTLIINDANSLSPF